MLGNFPTLLKDVINIACNLKPVLSFSAGEGISHSRRPSPRAGHARHPCTNTRG